MSVVVPHVCDCRQGAGVGAAAVREACRESAADAPRTGRFESRADDPAAAPVERAPSEDVASLSACAVPDPTANAAPAPSASAPATSHTGR